MAALEINPLEHPAWPPAEAVPVLRFDQVTVRFDDKPALVDVSFEIYAGETRVVFGAAGSGKTVLLKTAIGLIRPDAGQVYLFGQNITTLREEDQYAWRQRVGVLFQEGGLFDSLTVEENVAYPPLYQRERKPAPSEVEAQVKEALTFVGLAQTMERYPA